MPNYHGQLHDWTTRSNDKTLSKCSLTQTLRALRLFCGRRGGPSKSTLKRLVAKFETTGSVNNQPTPVRSRKARSAKSIAAVRESVQQNPWQSIPCRAHELGLSQTSTWLKVHNHRLRRLFSDWASNRLEENTSFERKIIFSDEAHWKLDHSVALHRKKPWRTFERCHIAHLMAYMHLSNKK